MCIEKKSMQPKCMAILKWFVSVVGMKVHNS